MSEAILQIDESELDRARELTSIGAGHAAGAFARIVGRPCRMRVPTVRLLRSESFDSPFVALARDDERRSMCGVFFEVEGGLGGVLALLFPAASRAHVVAALLQSPAPSSDGAAEESALRELGNMLVSHAVSAMADTLGTRVLPSIPVLAMDDAISALQSLIALRCAGEPALRIETEISDAERRYRGLLVYVPDPACLRRGAAGTGAPPSC
jgi:chemotaxis protein CheY-P-specific phosphatase CheC